MTMPPPPPAERVARAHYFQQVALAQASANAVLTVWGALDLTAIARSWAALLSGPTAILTTAQWQAASSADGYVDDILEAQGIGRQSAGRVNPNGFAGIASDGRPLETLLYEPAIATLQAIKQGATPAQAKMLGAVRLDAITRTQVADAGRVADGIAVAARAEVGGYVRMLNPPSCSRCALLAGRWYRWNEGFARHPRCDCRHIPSAEDAADDLRTEPKLYFDSLDQAEQDRVFTKAGAEAIRDGADISRVVNTRRGMYTAAGRKLTTEATTRRGTGRKIRLMPEQIYLEANGNREEAIRLLRLHGYLL